MNYVFVFGDIKTKTSAGNINVENINANKFELPTFTGKRILEVSVKKSEE